MSEGMLMQKAPIEKLLRLMVAGNFHMHVTKRMAMCMSVMLGVGGGDIRRKNDAQKKENAKKTKILHKHCHPPRLEAV
ncbi:MAG: hypothetical protein ING26_16360 [Roseomonas sp.]|nr:hypothetical protein [Roseomonas sp.]MCA3298739.1 hypothetical protein [Roseomonas sp.]